MLAMLPAENDPALAVIRRLADARLLVTGRDALQMSAQIVEIAHEALIQNWGLLQQWVNEDREFLRTRERIEAAAAVWEREGKHEDRLLAAGRPLAEAKDLLKQRRSDLGTALVRFIEASQAAEQRRQERQQAAHQQKLKRTRVLLAASLTALFVIAGLLVYADHQKANAVRERQTALSRGLAAQASLLVERGHGENTMLQAGALAVESWRRRNNVEAYATALKLLQWMPVVRIEPVTGTETYPAQLEFSPDGRFLAVAIPPFTRLFETAAGRELWRTNVHEASGFTHIQFSSDSRLLLVDDRKQACLISTGNAREVFSSSAGKPHTFLFGKGFRTATASMSRDGRWLALTEESGATRKDIISIIDTATGGKACRIEHPMNRTQGNLIVFLGSGGERIGIRDWPSVHLFGVPSGREQAVITVDHILDAYFIAEDRRLVVEEHDRSDDPTTFHLFDAENGRALGVIPTGKNERLEFSADGRLAVAINERENVVRLLEVPTGTERGRWQESVDDAFFDGGGQRLIIKSGKGAVVMDTASGQEKARIHPGCEVRGVAPADASDSLLVTCDDGQVHAFGMSTGEETARFQAGTSPAISPDGRLIISQDEALGFLRINEAATGKEFGRIATNGTVPAFLTIGIPGMSAFSRDGRRIAIPGSQGSIQLVDLSQAYSPLMLEAAKDGNIVLSRDHRPLSFAGPDHAVRVVDTTTGRTTGLIQDSAPAYPVHISADGRFLTTKQEAFLRIHEIASGREIVRLEQGWRSSIDISPDDHFLVIQPYESDVDRLVSASTLKEILRYPSEPLCCLPVFSPDGRSFAMADRVEHIVQVFDTETGAERMRIVPEEQFINPMGPCCPVFSPDGRTLAVDVLGTVKLFDLSASAWLKQRFTWKGANSLKPGFSPDGRTLAVAYARGAEGLAVAIFDVGTGKLLDFVHSGSWGGGGSGTFEPLLKFGFAFSPDSRYFAAGAAAGAPAGLFETTSGKALAKMELGWGFAGVAFSPDGRYLAAVSTNGAVRLLDVEGRRLLASGQHAMAVTHLEFSRDSRFLVTSSEDGTVRMIDTLTGQDVARFEHGAPVAEAHFSADGKSLLTISDHEVKIWPADPEWPFQQLCARAGRNLSPAEWRTQFGESEPWRATCENWHNPAPGSPAR